MPRAPALRGDMIRAEPDVRLIGDKQETTTMHSILLMTLSPYFQIVLNDTSEPMLVRIVGADNEILMMIHEYAYEGRLTGISVENVKRLYKVADMYNIIGIINECQLYMRNNGINPDLAL